MAENFTAREVKELVTSFGGNALAGSDLRPLGNLKESSRDSAGRQRLHWGGGYRPLFRTFKRACFGNVRNIAKRINIPDMQGDIFRI